ncbi:PAS domain S-box protein [Bacillota bacterium LX-D]|nr:PAS domain S-box protein [Bacillota bacterium LX-D]
MSTIGSSKSTQNLCSCVNAKSSCIVDNLKLLGQMPIFIKDVIFRYGLGDAPGIEYISPSITSITGYEPEDFYADSKLCSNIIHPEDRQLLKESINLPELCSCSLTIRLIKKDNTLVYLELCNSILYDEQGKMVALIGTGRDITERVLMESKLIESEKRFRNAFEYANIGMSITDLDGRFLKVNQAFCTFLGYKEQELLNLTLKDVTYQEDLDSQMDYIKKLAEGGMPSFCMEKRYLHKNGQVIWGLVGSSVVQDNEGAPLYFISQVQNIDDRKKIEIALEESEARFRSIVENVREVLWLGDLASEQIIYVNPSYEEIWGLSCQSLYDNPFSFLNSIVAEDKEKLLAAFKKIRTEGKGFNEEFRIIRPDGTIRWIWSQAILVEGKEHGTHRLVGVAEDITKRKVLEQELKLLATTDALTGADNRYSFLSKAEQEFTKSKLHNLKMSVLMLDLDYFKKINDTYGHNFGDKVLKAASQVCKKTLRITDFFGRIGGEEFVALLVNTDTGAAIDMAERLRSNLANLGVEFNNTPVYFTVSIGVATLNQEDTSFENILKRADEALYSAKKAGRNRVTLYTCNSE